MYKIICEPFRSISPITVPIVEERQWNPAKTFQNIELSQVRQSSSSLTLPFTYHDYKSTVRNRLLTTVQDNIYVLHTKTDQFRVVASRSRISFFKSPYGGPQTSMVTFCLRAKFHHHHQSVLSAAQQNQLLQLYKKVVRFLRDNPQTFALLLRDTIHIGASGPDRFYVPPFSDICRWMVIFMRRNNTSPQQIERVVFSIASVNAPDMFLQITLCLQHFPHSTFYVFIQCIKNVSVHRFFFLQTTVIFLFVQANRSSVRRVVFGLISLHFK